MTDKKFLFICGCARSGTTAFTHLFTAHYRIVMGMERYANLVRPGNFQLTPEHFSKQRFLEVQPDDTFYDDFEAFHKFDTQIADKYDGCIYIGDKRPDLYLAYNQLFTSLPNSKVFFIYREPIAVASSYQARSEKGKHWPAWRNYQAAIEEWNQSLQLTLAAIENGHSIYPVNYDDVFSSEKPLDKIFEILNMDMPESVQKRIIGLRRRAKELNANRKSLLNKNQIDIIREKIDGDAYIKIKSLNLLS